MSKPWLLVTIIAVSAAIGGAYVMLGAHEAAVAANAQEVESPEQRQSNAVQVEAITPAKGGLARTTTQPGSIIPDKSAELYAKVSGYLDKQNVDIGDEVKKGDVLAVIEMPELYKQADRSKAAVDQAKAQVKQAEARVITAQADWKAAKETIKLHEANVDDAQSMLNFRNKVYERMRKLAIDEKAIDLRLVDEKEEQMHASAAALTSAKAAVLSAEAQAAAAEAKIDQAKADLVNAQALVEVADAQWQKDKVLAEYTVIKSPYDGIVTSRHYWPGDFVQARDQGAAFPLLTVQKTNVMRVKIQVPDADVPYTDAGDEATVSIDALPDKHFSGKVSRIAGAEDSETRTMRVEIDLDNQSGILRDGMYGKVTIHLETASSGLSVPSSCLSGETESGKAAVYVLRNGKAHQVEVQVGEDNGLVTEIVAGLRPDDKVLRPLRGTIGEGIAVQVVQQGPPARAKSASH